MQDNLSQAMEGLGNILLQFEKSQALITPVLDEIKNNAHNVDPSVIAKYNDAMDELNVQRDKLDATIIQVKKDEEKRLDEIKAARKKIKNIKNSKL